MDANKMEVNEAFIAEWLKHESLPDVKAQAYRKIAMPVKMIWELF